MLEADVLLWVANKLGWPYLRLASEDDAPCPLLRWCINKHTLYQHEEKWHLVHSWMYIRVCTFVPIYRSRLSCQRKALVTHECWCTLQFKLLEKSHMHNCAAHSHGLQWNVVFSISEMLQKDYRIRLVHNTHCAYYLMTSWTMTSCPVQNSGTAYRMSCSILDCLITTSFALSTPLTTTSKRKIKNRFPFYFFPSEYKNKPFWIHIFYF
jgi:hypothetical protein